MLGRKCFGYATCTSSNGDKAQDSSQLTTAREVAPLLDAWELAMELAEAFWGLMRSSETA